MICYHAINNREQKKITDHDVQCVQMMLFFNAYIINQITADTIHYHVKKQPQDPQKCSSKDKGFRSKSNDNIEEEKFTLNKGGYFQIFI